MTKSVVSANPSKWNMLTLKSRSPLAAVGGTKGGMSSNVMIKMSNLKSGEKKPKP